MLYRWWIKDSVARNVVAAWQMIGAASAADALRDRNLTGKFDLTAPVSYEWTAEDGIGWSTDPGYLLTNIVPQSYQFTFLIRCKFVNGDAGGSGLRVFGNDEHALTFYGPFIPGIARAVRFTNIGNADEAFDYAASHVYAISGNRAFIDGTLKDIINTSPFVPDPARLAFAQQMSDPALSVVGLHIEAASLYDGVLMDEDVIELSNRMAALLSTSAPPSVSYHGCRGSARTLSPRSLVCCPTYPARYRTVPTDTAEGGTGIGIPGGTQDPLQNQFPGSGGGGGTEQFNQPPPDSPILPPWLNGKPWTPDLLFAYHAVAESYNASKVNLVNPGTYDLYPWPGDPRNPGYPYQIDPDWDGATWKTHCTEYGGWLGIDTSRLQTGYTRPDLDTNWTISVRAKKNHDPGSIYPDLDYLSVLFQAGGTAIRLNLDSDPPVPYDYGQVRAWHFSENEFFNDSRTDPIDTNEWHTYTMTGRSIYVDGVLLPTSSPGVATPYTTDWGGLEPLPNELGFGAMINWGPPSFGYLRTMGGVQWMTSMVAINRVLSGVEVAALVAVQP